MKKTLLFIGLCALLVLTGCASKKNLENTPKTPTSGVKIWAFKVGYRN